MKIAVGEEEELIRSLWISLLGIVFKPREYKSILLLLVQYCVKGANFLRRRALKFRPTEISRPTHFFESPAKTKKFPCVRVDSAMRRSAWCAGCVVVALYAQECRRHSYEEHMEPREGLVLRVPEDWCGLLCAPAHRHAVAHCPNTWPNMQLYVSSFLSTLSSLSQSPIHHVNHVCHIPLLSSFIAQIPV